MTIFQSVFAGRISAYIELRQALGFRSGDIAYFLKVFDRHLYEKKYAGLLTQELALEFACANAKASTNYCVSRYQAIRQFSEYLATFDPQTPFLDPKALKPSKGRIPPSHLYRRGTPKDSCRSAEYLTKQASMGVGSPCNDWIGCQHRTAHQ